MLVVRHVRMDVTAILVMVGMRGHVFRVMLRGVMLRMPTHVTTMLHMMLHLKSPYQYLQRVLPRLAIPSALLDAELT